MKSFFIRKSNNLFNDQSGFALTQVLIISIGLAIGITSLISSSILRLSTSKTKTLENNSRNSAYAAIANIRSLFNNTKGPFNYYWLSKVCSSNVKNTNSECPSFNSFSDRNNWPGMLSLGKFPDLSNLFWVDSYDKWCQKKNNSKNSRCFGRQVAPKCTYAGKLRSAPIDWMNLTNKINFILDSSEEKVGRIIPKAFQENKQSYLINSINYVGKEHGGENTIFVEGFTRSNSNNQKNITSTNKIRVTMAVNKIVPDSGFAFISAGENENDRDNSLFLGNLSVNGKGSILWRRNVYKNSDCTQILSKVNVQRQNQLPDNTKSEGGLWVQPLEFPSEPEHKIASKAKTHKLDSVFCSPSNWTDRSSKCTDLDNFSRGGTNNGKVEIDNLFVQGDGAVFSVTTNENNRVTLVFNGDVEISNNGKFCHRHNRGGACGSGKPENLTIMFKQPNSAKQEIFCETKGGGMTLANGFNSGNHTFVLSSTGKKSSEKFSGFIYGPTTTLTTAKVDNDYYQLPNSYTRQIVISRGAYGIVTNPHGSTSSEKSPKSIRYNGRKIAFSNQRIPAGSVHLLGWKIIAAGNRQGGYQIPPNNPMDTMILLWYPHYNYYRLYGLNDSHSSHADLIVQAPGKTAMINIGTNLNKKNPYGVRWLDYYGIKLNKSNNTNPVKINGVAWMKNLCLDKGPVIWDFDKKTPKELEKRYTQEIKFGVPYYRSKVITAWDTLRDFDSP